MKHFVIFLSFYIGLVHFAAGQTIEKNKGKAGDENFIYYSIEPKIKVCGILILLHASGEKPQSILDKTKLPMLLAEKGYLILLPQLHNTLFADQFTIDELNEVLKTQVEKYNTSNIFIGGLSSGGALAIDYTEYLSSSNPGNYAIKGVFAIDSPLDLTRIYASSIRKINYPCHGLVMKEGYSIKNSFEATLGGSPETKPDQYLKFSAYSANVDNGGKAKYLKNIPVRLYSEPDLNFVRKAYCEDLQFEDLNAFDAENLAKFLMKASNVNAQYIATSGKGFHSWNIVDAEDCTNWILKFSN